MTPQELNQLFRELETEQLVEALLQQEKTDELQALIKDQLGQEFIKLLAIAETLDIDLEEAINEAVAQLTANLAESCCGNEECTDEQCTEEQ